jgi:predicted XRE-type DNA-binding protein
MPRWIDPIPDLKRQVADEILVLMDGWSQAYASWFVHVSRARISEMRSGNLENISLERLIQCLTHLGRCVELISRRSDGPSVHEHWKLDGRKPPVMGGRSRRAPESG